MKYLVYLKIFRTMDVEIEADTPEEAREKGESEAYVPGLCWQCAQHIELSDEPGEITAIEEVED
jgi:hypothetical protein